MIFGAGLDVKFARVNGYVLKLIRAVCPFQGRAVNYSI
jgi:hypothetical protein